MAVRDDPGIVHQVLGNDTVQHQQDKEGNEKEQGNAADEKKDAPKRFHCGQAHKDLGSVHVLLLAIRCDG